MTDPYPTLTVTMGREALQKAREWITFAYGDLEGLAIRCPDKWKQLESMKSDLAAMDKALSDMIVEELNNAA